MITSSGPSPIDDPAMLSKQLARGVQASVAFNPGVDRKELLRQEGALINTIGQLTGDDTGDSTITANTAFNAQLREVFKGVDNAPTDPMGKLQVLRTNEELRNKFLEKLRGEEIYKPQFEQLVQQDSDATKLLEENYQANRPGDTQEYDRKVPQVASATPQLSNMQLRARTSTALEYLRNAQDESAMLSEVRKTVSTALADTRPQDMGGFVYDYLTDWTSKGGLEGNTALEEVVSGIAELSKRREALTSDGIQPGEAEKIKAIDTIISALRGTAINNIRNQANLDYSGFEDFSARMERGGGYTTSGGLGTDSGAFDEQRRGVGGTVIQALQDIRKAMEDVARSSKAIAASNEAMVDPAKQTAAASEKTAENVAKAPSAVGALGSAANTP